MALVFTDAGDNTSAKRVARVRRLAGNLSSSDISDDDTIEIINRQDDWMLMHIGITDSANFTSSDSRWTQGLQAGELMAAAEINDGIPTNSAASKAKDQRLAARDIIKAMNKKDSDIQQTTITTISDGVNITNELDPANYTPEQDVFG